MLGINMMLGNFYDQRRSWIVIDYFRANLFDLKSQFPVLKIE